MRAILLCCLLLFLLLVKESAGSSNWLNDERSLIHQEISFLRGENHNQNIKIARLQEKVGLEEEDEELNPTKLSTDLPENKKCTLKESSQQLPSTDFHPHRRQKRPERLTPLELLFHRNGTATTGTDQQQLREFYGPPANCSDLSQLGYTLNGFYLIKSTAANSLIDTLGLTQLEAVFCAFKQPGSHLNSPDLEKRVGFLKLDGKASPTSDVTTSPTKQGNEVQNASFQTKTNNESSSSDKLIFHLQIKSNSIVQKPGAPVEFDNIILNADKSYDPKTLAFFAPVTGNYKFVFETEVLEEKNVTFRYSGRLPPDYKHGWTLTEAAPSDLNNNIVKMVTTIKLGKSTRIQVKSVGTTDGKYTLSSSYPTFFKGYLLA